MKQKKRGGGTGNSILTKRTCVTEAGEVQKASNLISPISIFQGGVGALGALDGWFLFIFSFLSFLFSLFSSLKALL